MNKPDDEALVQLLEGIGHYIWQAKREGRYFTFALNNKDWDQHPSHGGSPKTEIVQSRRDHPREWKKAKAVVLSHRGKTKHNLDIVVGPTSLTYRLSVDIRTGEMKWQPLNTKLATLLREAYEVAHR